MAIISFYHAEFLFSPHDTVNLLGLSKTLTDPPDGKEVADHRKDQIGFGSKCLHEVWLVQAVAQEGRHTLLGILQTNYLQQPLPGGDVAGRRGHFDPIV